MKATRVHPRRPKSAGQRAPQATNQLKPRRDGKPATESAAGRAPYSARSRRPESRPDDRAASANPVREQPSAEQPSGNQPLGDKPAGAKPVKLTKVRLQRYLAMAGIGSRRECESLITAGRVFVDGEAVTTLGTSVDPTTQDVEVDGEKLKIEAKSYWLLNKPPGVLCTRRDPSGRRTVMEMVPAKLRLNPVGRLDEDSTGLLVMTNDGDLAFQLTHPKFGVPKTYEVLVAGEVNIPTLGKLREGIWLSVGKCRPKSIRKLGTVGRSTRLEVVLTEGHNREIRRMFAQVGHKVLKLARTAVGDLKIRKLPLGSARPATPEEVGMLKAAARQVVEAAASAQLARDRGEAITCAPPRNSRPMQRASRTRRKAEPADE